MELAGVLQLFSYFIFGYWAFLHVQYPNWVPYVSCETVIGFYYIGIVLIAIQNFFTLKVVTKLQRNLYPSNRTVKILRFLILVNSYVILAPMYHAVLSFIALFMYTGHLEDGIKCFIGIIAIVSQIGYTYITSYLSLYYKLPIHQGIGRFDQISQNVEFLLLILQGFSYLLNSSLFSVVIGIFLCSYLTYRCYRFPSFQSVFLCQCQISIYVSYLAFMLMHLFFMIFPFLNISSFLFSVVQGFALFWLIQNFSKNYFKSFYPDTNLIRLTQSLLKGQLTIDEYHSKLPLLINVDNLFHFLCSIHFLSNYNVVEELDGDDSSTGTRNSQTKSADHSSNLLLSRHKGHYILSNAVYNCLVFAESKFENCAILKRHIVRYCWTNFGVIEDKSRAIELENQLILGKRNLLANSTLVLVSTLRKLKNLAEFSSENDVTLLMKNSYEEFCIYQMKRSSTSLYTILKALQTGKDTKLHLLSHLFVQQAQNSFYSIKKLFQKYPQDASTLKLLSIFLISIENDKESGDYVLQTMDTFDSNKGGMEKDILNMTTFKDDVDMDSRRDSISQFDFVGKFLIINENMKKNRFECLKWQSHFHYSLNFSLFILLVSLAACIILNGYTLIDYIGLQLNFSQVASVLPIKRQKTDACFLKNGLQFETLLLDLEDATTDLIYMGRLDSYETIRYLDTSTIWSPNLINETHYSLVKASYLDTNLDQITLYANPLIPDSIKRIFVSFSTFTASISQIDRLIDYTSKLSARMSEKNTTYLEFSFIPLIGTCIILIVVVAFLYVYKLNRSRLGMLNEIKKRIPELSIVAAEMKAKVFTNIEEHHAHLQSAMESYNLKVKSKSKSTIGMFFVILACFSIILLILYLIFTVREDSIRCASFQADLTLSSALVGYAYHHIQSLGTLNISSPNLVALHQKEFYSGASTSISTISDSMANLASYIRHPYFIELNNYDYYKSLILEKYCMNEICEESLDFTVNEFSRRMEDCFKNNCLYMQDIMDTIGALSVWDRLEIMQNLLVKEDLLGQRRVKMLAIGIMLTICLLLLLYLLIRIALYEKEQTLAGYV